MIIKTTFKLTLNKIPTYDVDVYIHKFGISSVIARVLLGFRSNTLL